MIRLHHRGGSKALCGLINFRAGLGFNRRGHMFSVVPKLTGTRFIHCKIVRHGACVGSPNVLSRRFYLGTSGHVCFTNRVANIRNCVRSTTSKVCTNVALTELLLNLPRVALPRSAVLNTLSGCIRGNSVNSFRPVNSGVKVLPSLPRQVHNGRRGCRILTGETLRSLRERLSSGGCAKNGL